MRGVHSAHTRTVWRTEFQKVSEKLSIGELSFGKPSNAGKSFLVAHFVARFARLALTLPPASAVPSQAWSSSPREGGGAASAELGRQQKACSTGANCPILVERCWPDLTAAPVGHEIFGPRIGRLSFVRAIRRRRNRGRLSKRYASIIGIRSTRSSGGEVTMHMNRRTSPRNSSPAYWRAIRWRLCIRTKAASGLFSWRR